MVAAIKLELVAAFVGIRMKSTVRDAGTELRYERLHVKGLSRLLNGLNLTATEGARRY
jgi:hypothetical protein